MRFALAGGAARSPRPPRSPRTIRSMRCASNSVACRRASINSRRNAPRTRRACRSSADDARQRRHRRRYAGRFKLPGSNTSVQNGGYLKLDAIYDRDQDLGDTLFVDGLSTSGAQREDTSGLHARESRCFSRPRRDRPRAAAHASGGGLLRRRRGRSVLELAQLPHPPRVSANSAASRRPDVVEFMHFAGYRRPSISTARSA